MPVYSPEYNICNMEKGFGGQLQCVCVCVYIYIYIYMDCSLQDIGRNSYSN